MNADKPTRPDRVENMLRSMLAFALLAAVVWALTSGGGGFDYFHSLPGT
jgi:hypothetical protein